MKLIWSEDVEPLEMRVEEVEDCGEERDDDGEDSEGAHPRPGWRRRGGF